MGKLMVVVTRFLSLSVLLLAIPAIASAQCISKLTVQRVWTQDTGGNIKTAFALGETIQFVAELNNTYGGTLLAANGTQLTITTSFYNDTRPVDIPPGISTWPWNATAPPEQGNYTATVKAYDHFCGTLPEGSASFTVGQSTALTITLPVTVRDFCGIGFDANACPQGYVPHPDFENMVISDDRGLVDTTLGKDGRPVPIANFPTATVQSADSFNQWYHNKAGINQTATVALTLTETSPGSSVYDNNNFFPIDGEFLGNQGQVHNYSFTLALHAAFKYVPGQVFEITGDDDIWVFINNQLVIDLGGVHPAESAFVNLDTLGLTEGQGYNFDLFFAERHTTESNLKFQTSIVFEPFQFQELPVAFDSINYINWYGNTKFAYQNRNGIYSALQGLHSGIDFIAPDGTPIKSVVNSQGVVVSINNVPHDYRAGPGNVLIDYGDFLVLYGHTQESNRPEKIKPGAVIDPNDTIAYVGADTGGLIHLHLEVIRKKPPGSSGRPGNIRTNPVPFFSSTALGQLKQKAKGIGAEFQPISGETKWQTPEVQPDITPGGPLLVP